MEQVVGRWWVRGFHSRECWNVSLESDVRVSPTPPPPIMDHVTDGVSLHYVLEAP